MTSDSLIVDEAETLLRRLSDQLTMPSEGECLCCFVARQLDEFGCNGTHRHAERYRDLKAPRATALKDRMSRVGACCCDCELFLNGYRNRSDPSDDEDFDVEAAVPPIPPCAGVRRGSIQPCANWVRQRRW